MLLKIEGTQWGYWQQDESCGEVSDCLTDILKTNAVKTITNNYFGLNNAWLLSYILLYLFKLICYNCL